MLPTLSTRTAQGRTVSGLGRPCHNRRVFLFHQAIGVSGTSRETGEHVSELMTGLSILQDRRIEFLHSPRIAQSAQDIGAYLVVDEPDGAVGHDKVCATGAWGSAESIT